MNRVTQRDAPGASDVDAQTPSTAWARYRAWYHARPPQLQMIGLQLWLPLLFVCAFCLCYIVAFHSPNPRDVPVAVVAPQAQAAPAVERLQAATGDTFEFTTRTSLEAAREDVRRGDIAAAFALPAKQGAPATLVVSSAASFQLENVARQAFGGVAAGQDTTLKVEDISPLPKGDSYGTALFYLTLVWTISAYMVGMFVGLMGGGLSSRTRIGMLVVLNLGFSLLGTLLAGPIIGAFEGHFWAMWGLGWAGGTAVSLTVNGLSYFVGRFVTGWALILFVFLNIPASGGAFPPTFVPEFFHDIHPLVIGTGMMGAARDIVYGVGDYLGWGLVTIAAWALVGLLLSAFGDPYAARKQRRRTLSGAMPMMSVAQRHLMEHHRAQAEAVHAEAAAADEEEQEERRRREEEQEETDEAVGAAGGAGAAATA
jgi:hypothetical protein